MRRLAAVLLAAAALIGAPHAAPSDDPLAASDPAAANDPAVVKQAEAVAGNYTLERIGDVPAYCPLKLEVVGSYNMFRVWLAPTCIGQNEWISFISGWEPLPAGAIKIVGAEGSTWAEFKTNPETGDLEGTIDADPQWTYRLAREPAKYPPQ